MKHVAKRIIFDKDKASKAFPIFSLSCSSYLVVYPDIYADSRQTGGTDRSRTRLVCIKQIHMRHAREESRAEAAWKKETVTRKTRETHFRRITVTSITHRRHVTHIRARTHPHTPCTRRKRAVGVYAGCPRSRVLSSNHRHPKKIAGYRSIHIIRDTTGNRRNCCILSHYEDTKF